MCMRKELLKGFSYVNFYQLELSSIFKSDVTRACWQATG